VAGSSGAPADGEQPEREFVAGIAASLPRKRVAAGALLRDDLARVLLVEPVYKPTWELPGGVVEADESPLDGCRREIAEELGPGLGLALRGGDLALLVVDWVPRSGPWADGLLFVFDGGVHPADVLRGAALPPDELRAVHLEPLDTAAPHLRPGLLRRLAVAVDVAATGGPTAYCENGVRRR